ncbi:MAG: hypothetical protein C4325_03065 [Blastocatellia bacterium]
MILHSIPRAFRIAALLSSVLLGLSTFSCSGGNGQSGKTSESSATANPPVNLGNTNSSSAEQLATKQTSSQDDMSIPDENPAKTPREAYERLFAAVKSGNTQEIKAAVSLRTQQMAQTLAERQNESIAKVYSNGFTRTTMTDRMPKMRDERVKGLMGAVEVWSNADQRWEDIPFIFENGSWKLAYGDLWQNTWQSPGPGQAALEAQAANLSRRNGGVRRIELPKNVNAMVNPVNSAPKKNP